MKEWAEDKLRWVVEPGPWKSAFFGFGGLGASWAVAEAVLKSLILIATATLVLIHLINALVRQWCPVRRQKMESCDQCKFKGSIFCSRCIKQE